MLINLLIFLPRVAMAKHALTALEWSCIVTHHQKPLSSSLLLSLATFLTAVSSTKLWNSAVKKLFSLWDGGGQMAEETVTTLLEGSPSPPSLLLLSVLAQFCREHCTSLWKEKRVCDWSPSPPPTPHFSPTPHSSPPPPPPPPFPAECYMELLCGGSTHYTIHTSTTSCGMVVTPAF